MFISFKAGNTGSLKLKTGITTKCDIAKKEHFDTLTFKAKDDRFNKVNYLFGANGAGKTNYFVALTKMQRIIMTSTILGANNNKLLEVPAIKNEISMPIDTFQFDVDFQLEPSEFEIEIMLNNIIYNYSFKIRDGKILEEYLSKRDKRTEYLIKRSSSNHKDIVLRSDMSSFKNNTNVVREDSLCLAMAAMLNHELANTILDEIMNYKLIHMMALGGAPVFDDRNFDESTKEKYIKYLKIADPTLIDFQVDFEEKADKHTISDDFENKELIITNIKVDIKSKHNIFKNQEIYKEEELPFLQFESNGTIRFFGILPSIFKALDEGGTIFIDEIENGLHPNLVKVIINLFNSEITNPKNAQLICTSHNILFLNNVRRDQVWFAEKDIYGVTNIKRLSDLKNIRANDKLAEKYLEGIFGAVPNID